MELLFIVKGTVHNMHIIAEKPSYVTLIKYKVESRIIKIDTMSAYLSHPSYSKTVGLIITEFGERM